MISLTETVEFLPNKPGVYQFLNSSGDIIYIGKAKDLKKRVSSYFNKLRYDSNKVKVMVSKVHEIKHIIVETESDALLLENNLIKKYKPKYNILLKDDKTYPWICIKNESYPRVISTRNYVNDGSQYFGPYTSGMLMKTMLDLVRSLFPLRNCNLSLTEQNIKSGKFKPCLEYQVGNCLAPCIAMQTYDNYQENIAAIVDILKGNIHAVKRIITLRMIELSKLYQFEEAQRCKDKLDALERYQAKSTIVNPKLNDIDIFSIEQQGGYSCVNYLKIVNGLVVQSHNLDLRSNLDETPADLLSFAIAELRQRLSSTAREVIVPFQPEYKLTNCTYTVPIRGDKLKLLELSSRNAKAFLLEKQSSYEKQNPQQRVERILKTIQDDFRISELPRHIECFDNSNLQGTNAVSACIVFRNGKPSKKEYRIFNVRTVEGPDDFATMREVIERRYSRLIESSEPLPQLIVIDGGKGQLSATYNVLKDLGIEQKVKVVGIAKRLEEIFFPGDPVPIYLNKNSESLKVIQNARNEAHRFGITHHRNRRSRNFTTSQLQQIEGIGEKTAQQLLIKYKSVSKIALATEDELASVIGKSKAKQVFGFFHEKEGDK